MAQNVTWPDGTQYTNVPFINLPKTGGGQARFTDVSPTDAVETDVAQGKTFFKADGSQATGTNQGGGGGMNLQVNTDLAYSMSTSYTDIGMSITVAVSGTYTISYIGWRASSFGTSGTQIYINDTAYDSAYTTFTETYGQHITKTGVSLSVGDVVSIRARARNSSNYMYVGNLVIQQTS